MKIIIFCLFSLLNCIKGLLLCDHDKTLALNTSGVEIHFYDFEKDRHVENHINNALQDIFSQNLNITRKLVFYIPGYKSDMNSSLAKLIKEEFRKASDIYLIIVDYSAYTTPLDPIPPKTYKLSVFYAYYIGRSVALFLTGFRDKGFTSARMHGIGHSFGGQILGYIGDEYFKKSSEKIGRLSGVDPASFCFSNSSIENQIRSGIAEYVEVYHCNAGAVGTNKLLADADFFFGDGRNQPQCVKSTDLVRTSYVGLKREACSHIICLNYFASTVNSPGFRAKACHSYKAFKEDACADNNETLAGYRGSDNATGVYYISEELFKNITGFK